MHDGKTRKLKQSEAVGSELDFFASHRATLVLVAGPGAGTEFALERGRVCVGRGDSADLSFDDAAMSREHAAFELSGGGYRIRDLASSNGVLVNGGAVLVADLKHGDRIELGEHRFQYLLETREREPSAYDLSDS